MARSGGRTSALALALALVAMARPAWAEPYRFLKGPYLQGLGETSALVRWEGVDVRGATVRVTAPGFERAVRTDTKATFHSVEVTGLAPGTTYDYAVEGDGEGAKADGHFTTAPSDGRAFSFLVYGDSRSDAAAHERAVRAMREAPSDFLVNTGDMVADGDDTSLWADFFRVETPLLRDRCVFACVGNHELIGRGASNYLRYFHPGFGADGRPRGAADTDSLFYSVRWSTARFFFLNAMATWESGPDREWLERALERADSEEGVKVRFVVMHHGPYSAGPHGPNAGLARSGILELFRKHHVSLVIAGHDHIYERGEHEGVHYLVSGGAGAPLYKVRHTQRGPAQAAEAAYHFVAVRVEGNAVAIDARRVDGTLMEACGFADNGPWSCTSSALAPTAIAAAASATPTHRDLAPHPDSAAKRQMCGCRLVGVRQPTSRTAWCFGVMAAGLAIVRKRRRTTYFRIDPVS